MKRACFLPHGYLEKKGRRKSDVIFATILGVVIGSTAVVALAMQISLKQLQDQHAQVQWQCAQALKTIQDIKQMRQDQQAVAQRAERTASIVESVSRSSILAEVARALPTRVSLVDLTLESIPDDFTNASQIKLTGSAPSERDVNQTIAELNRSQLFVNVIRADPVGGTLPTFKLEMSLNPKATGQPEIQQAPSRIVELPAD